MSELASINMPPGQGIAAFGAEIVGGDVNGDGFPDIISSSFNSGYPGKVYIWYGGFSFDTLIDVTLSGPNTGPYGSALGCGDVNKDGYDDILVTREAFSAYLYFGGDPMDTTPDWLVHPQTSNQDFGSSAAVSDLNNDGYADIIIGDAHAGELPDDPGAVFIFWGGDEPDTLCDESIFFEYGINSSNFGWKISSGYDVNGDGISDLAVGAPTAPGGLPRIYIYYGGSAFDTICDVRIYNPCGELEYGYCVPLVKDLNGDGYDDLAAGAHYHDRVYVYYGGDPMDNSFDVVLSADTFQFGMYVIGIDNADNDNWGDLAVGSPHFGGNFPQKGRVYLYRGGTVFDTIADAYATGADSQEVGWRIGNVGDINSDGRDEIAFSNCASWFLPKRIWIATFSGVGIEENTAIIPDKTELLIACPNPFNSFTNIFFTASECCLSNERYKLKIFDIRGRLMKILALSPRQKLKGWYVIEWNGKDEFGKEVPDGIYIMELYDNEKGCQVGNSKKIIKIK
jgi:hypothetical protein